MAGNAKHILTRGIGLAPGKVQYFITEGFGTAVVTPITYWALNGGAASIQPYSVRWRKLSIGRDHTRRPLYSGNWEIDMSFDSASITFSRQWMEAASSGSLNMTVLKPYSIGWTDLSAVHLELVEVPTVESGMSGPWSMIIRGASPNG